MTVAEYLRIKNIIRNTTAVIKGGKHYRIFNGDEISEVAFKAMHKLPTVLNGSKENPDKRKMFLL